MLIIQGSTINVIVYTEQNVYMYVFVLTMLPDDFALVGPVWVFCAQEGHVRRISYSFSSSFQLYSETSLFSLIE